MCGVLCLPLQKATWASVLVGDIWSTVTASHGPPSSLASTKSPTFKLSLHRTSASTVKEAGSESDEGGGGGGAQDAN